MKKFNKIFGKIIIFSKQIKHKIYLWNWIIKNPKNDLDFLGHAFLSISSVWEGEIEPVLTYISMFDILRQNNFEGNFLEIGGGYSTILIPVLLNKSIQLQSIDINPDKYKRILNSSRNANLFLDKLKIIENPSVTYEEAIKGLQNHLNDLAKIEFIELKNSLSDFITEKEEVINMVKSIKKNTFLKKYILQHENFKEDYDFYSKFNMLTGKGICSEISKEKICFDAIFFDCGEISSVAEWLFLKDKIKKNGFALFHDIFYPKSIKNFLITTYILNSNDWKVLYVDKVSPQGGLVAQKI